MVLVRCGARGVAVIGVALVVLSALALAHGGPAAAGPVPDHVHLVLMRRSVEEVPLVRMRGDFGTLQGYRPLLDSSGVRLAERLGGSRNAMRTVVANSSQVEPVPWDQIASLETDRAGFAAMSTLIGGFIGLVAAAGIAVSSDDLISLRDQSLDNEGAMLASIVGGLALGYIIGRHGQRRTISPPREAK